MLAPSACLCCPPVRSAGRGAIQMGPYTPAGLLAASAPDLCLAGLGQLCQHISHPHPAGGTGRDRRRVRHTGRGEHPRPRLILAEQRALRPAAPSRAVLRCALHRPEALRCAMLHLLYVLLHLPTAVPVNFSLLRPHTHTPPVPPPLPVCAGDLAHAVWHRGVVLHRRDGVSLAAAARVGGVGCGAEGYAAALGGPGGEWGRWPRAGRQAGECPWRADGPQSQA